ncbi:MULTISPECIES: TadE/TadG family type IV pilus assembly protein [unclassified Streptomyces]|uniref:TadE/TadG family type IV pilus assembly protein n=1 Tax=unclassified Streptomyces TaxID=2593676 RepID=UPI00035F61BE|nr:MULTISPECIES: TadE/TadG family type IV pilus assembly protein [unclassified Streptomyces]MYQ77833.1 pilus assembly protein [Streptomyces sp. SID4923]
MVTRRRPGSRQRGQAAVEYVGVLTLLLVVALAVVQLGLAVYAAQQASTAARAAARVASTEGRQGRAGAVARESMSGWLADGATVSTGAGAESVTVTVRVSVPALLPMFSFGSVEKSATMPSD